MKPKYNIGDKVYDELNFTKRLKPLYTISGITYDGDSILYRIEKNGWISSELWVEEDRLYSSVEQYIDNLRNRADEISKQADELEEGINKK